MYHLLIFDISMMSYKSLKLFTFFWDTLQVNNLAPPPPFHGDLLQNVTRIYVAWLCISLPIPASRIHWTYSLNLHLPRTGDFLLLCYTILPRFQVVVREFVCAVSDLILMCTICSRCDKFLLLLSVLFLL